MHAPSRIALVAASLAFALTSYLALVVFRDYPFSGDEYGYWYQAQMFALGKLSLPMDPHLSPLVEVHMMYNKGQLFSKYSPGFSAILAFGVLIGIPGLVNPLISALTVIVLFVILRARVSEYAAVAVSFLVVINSYFLGYGGSYFSQPLVLLLAACSFYGFHRYESEAKLRNLIISGLAIAYTFLVRPLDGFCLWLAITCGAIAISYRRKTGFMDIALFSALAFTGLALLYGYNYLTADCFCVAKYTVWNNELRVVDPHAKSIWENIVSIFNTYCDSFMMYTAYNFKYKFITIIGLPFLGLVVLGIAFRRSVMSFICALFTVVLVLLYNFHPLWGWPQYGARYWYPAIVPLAILAAYGAETIKSSCSKYVFLTLIALTGIWQLYRFDQDINSYNNRFNVLQFLKSQIAMQCPAQSVVIIHLETPHGRLPSFVKIEDLQRNPFFNGPRLFVYDRESAEMVASYYPNYTICDYIPGMTITTGHK